MNDDLISRQAAIDVIKGIDSYFVKYIEELPPAQPERLTDDDFETIRIHLSAHKEELCNQRRWKEAEEYQRIIDRFMCFASEQPVRKKGGWETVKGKDSYIDFRCSICHRFRFHNGELRKYKFCPNCGADMRGDENV